MALSSITNMSKNQKNSSNNQGRGTNVNAELNKTVLKLITNAETFHYVIF